MQSLNFTNKMAQAMASLSQDTGRQQRDLPSSPDSRPHHNRLSNAFSRSFDPIPMN